MGTDEAGTATPACTAAWAWVQAWATMAWPTTTTVLLSTTAALTVTQERLTTPTTAGRPSTTVDPTVADQVDLLKPTWAVVHPGLADRTATRATRRSTCRLTWPALPCRTPSAHRSARPLHPARAASSTTSRRPTTPTSVRAKTQASSTLVRNSCPSSFEHAFPPLLRLEPYRLRLTQDQDKE